ncbi:Tyrosine-protein kinase Fer [Toxocara canis]|uniref:Tyrosine-protein kinase n=1 Tax=Toxocara canis TaxID=6265 RepID=A0A0B2VA34_TOXCA|nr:Tyrosine-protein kinase Fer [Toxocara canis]
MGIEGRDLQGAIRNLLMATKGFDSLPKEVEEAPFYHGLLPREDVVELLARVGDFMLRISQPKPTDPRELIISVRVAKDTSPSSIRHIIVRRQKLPQGDSKYLAVEALGFDSVDDLLQYYTTQKTPIHPQIKTSVLLNAVKRTPWEFHHEEVRLENLLGSGAFGEVRAGEVTIKGKQVKCAIKLAKIVKDEAKLIHAKEKIKEMMHEARLMRHYDHDNVVRIYGVAVDREPLMILIELVKGGSILSNLRKRRGTITDEEKLNSMTLGSAKGLAYLHSKGCIHRDIAARNVLYTKDKIAKISDFGMSREGGVYRMRHGKKVPIKWTAPETITKFIYSLKTDVFSFSILIWEVFSDGMEPYKGVTNTAVKKMVCAGFRMDMPECPDGVANLIDHCWEQEPKARWSMDEAVRELQCIIKKEAETRKKLPAAKKKDQSAKQISESSEQEEKGSSMRSTKSCFLERTDIDEAARNTHTRKKSTMGR